MARVRRSESRSLAREHVVNPILYRICPLDLESSKNEDQSGKEEWKREGRESPHDTYSFILSWMLHPESAEASRRKEEWSLRSPLLLKTI